MGLFKFFQSKPPAHEDQKPSLANRITPQEARENVMAFRNEQIANTIKYQDLALEVAYEMINTASKKGYTSVKLSDAMCPMFTSRLLPIPIDKLDYNTLEKFVIDSLSKDGYKIHEHHVGTLIMW